LDLSCTVKRSVAIRGDQVVRNSRNLDQSDGSADQSGLSEIYLPFDRRRRMTFHENISMSSLTSDFPNVMPFNDRSTFCGLFRSFDFAEKGTPDHHADTPLFLSFPRLSFPLLHSILLLTVFSVLYAFLPYLSQLCSQRSTFLHAVCFFSLQLLQNDLRDV
jgi:hypothetical protein